MENVGLTFAQVSSKAHREGIGLRVANSHTGNHPEGGFTPFETILSAKDTITMQRCGLSAKELNEFLSSYPIPSEYDVILPTSTQTIFDAPPGYVGLYTHSFSLANLWLPLTDFFCEVLQDAISPYVVCLVVIPLGSKSDPHIVEGSYVALRGLRCRNKMGQGLAHRPVIMGVSADFMVSSKAHREGVGLRVADSHTGNHPEGGFTPFETIRRVHTLLIDGTLTCFNMLVEKKYPLIKEMLENMLNGKLEAEADSTMAFELLKFIKSQLED
ncbi:hypothetical protein Tco_1238257 [Tanacetum coccineum]